MTQDNGSTIKFSKEEIEKVKAGIIPARIAKKLAGATLDQRSKSEQLLGGVGIVEFPLSVLEKGAFLTKQEMEKTIRFLVRNGRRLHKQAFQEASSEKAWDLNMRALMQICMARLLQSIELFSEYSDD